MPDKKELVELVKQFRGKKIAVVGDVLLDKYLFGKIERINPDRPGYPLLRVEREEHRLGGAGNVSLNLASLGARVSLFGAVGNDISGLILRKRCKKFGIRFFPVIEGQTLLKQRRIESTHNDYLGREDFGEASLEKLSLKSEKRLFNAIIRERPEMLVFADYNKKVFRGGFAQRLIKWAKGKGIPVAVDPKPSNISSFRGANIIRPNLKEAVQITGKEYDGKNLKDIASGLKELCGSESAVITCGSEGVIGYDGRFFSLPAESKEITDVTGAGDTFIAGLSLSLLCGADLLSSISIANIAAGISVEKLGAASVRQKELVERIEKNFG